MYIIKKGEMMGKEFISTAYFDSKENAVKYFASQETDKESVEKYIREGLIHIGVPKVKSEFDLSIDSDGRYWRKE